MRKEAQEPKAEGDQSACFCPVSFTWLYMHKDKHLKKGLGTSAEKFSTDC